MTGPSEEVASLEKLQRAEAATKIAVWTEAASWEGPLREFARASSPGSDLDRRLKFFRWEVASHVAMAADKHTQFDRSPDRELEALNEIFFQILGFRKESSLGTLETVLAKRQAPSSLLAMIYAWVAELFFRTLEKHHQQGFFQRIDIVVGVPLDVVRATPWPAHDVGRVTLLNLDKKGTKVPDQEWFAWAAKSKNGFVAKSMTEALIASLTELSNLMNPKIRDVSAEGAFDISIEQSKNRSNTGSFYKDLLLRQLEILDLIISLKPSDTKRLAERAILRSQLGYRQMALSDLKRFFAFHEKEGTPLEILELFEKLMSQSEEPKTDHHPDWS
jgi:hypothetical protein